MSKALFTISKEQVRGGKAGVEGESLYIELVEVGRIELPYQVSTWSFLPYCFSHLR